MANFFYTCCLIMVYYLCGKALASLPNKKARFPKCIFVTSVTNLLPQNPPWIGLQTIVFSISTIAKKKASSQGVHGHKNQSYQILPPQWRKDFNRSFVEHITPNISRVTEDNPTSQGSVPALPNSSTVFIITLFFCIRLLYML